MKSGVKNLLINCAKIEPGESVLVVREDPLLGWYTDTVSARVLEGLAELSITPTVIDVGPPSNEPDASILAAIDLNDCTIYLARLGDQDRFGQLPAGRRSVMCYARDEAMLESDYCEADYEAFKAFKLAIDQVIASATEIRVSCLLGTNLVGQGPGQEHGEQDVSVLRFPLGVPTPVLAETFSGQVAVAHFLTPTGSRVYDPPSVLLSSPAIVSLDKGRVSDIQGEPATVQSIRQHYEHVASLFNLDRDAVHSFHAGIHPACAYTTTASANPDRWSNTVFCNPRFVHFHTGALTPPAEICWMILDPTIRIDGVALWENGRLMPERFGPTQACLAQWPVLGVLCAAPSQEVGLVA